jgi:hypothetical protein
VPRLQLHLHHHGPLGVVGLGEHGPSTAGAILDDGLDEGRGAGLTTATTAPLRGRGGAPLARRPAGADLLKSLTPWTSGTSGNNATWRGDWDG